MKVIRIDNFGKGRDSFTDQVLLDQAAHASASSNIWAGVGALIPMPGQAIQASFTASANVTTGACAFPVLIAEDTVNTAFNIYYRLSANAGITSTSQGQYLFASSGFTDSLTPLGYSVGTVSVSGATRISATGSGTTWTTNLITGDRVCFAGTASAWYKIASVEDNTHLTLAEPTTIVIATGTAYTAQQTFASNQISYATLNGILSMGSSVANDTMQQYSPSTSVTRNSSAPLAAYYATHKNYLFCFRTTTAQSRLYWSTVKDPTTFPANNFLDVDKDQGIGTGMISYGNELICFKSRGMYRIVGDVFDPANPTFSVQRISTPPDFAFNCNRSVAVVNGQLIFWGLFKFYMYSAGTNYVTDISSQIVRDMPSTGIGNIFDPQSNDQMVKGISFNGNYIVKSVGAGFVLDKNNAWWYMNPATGNGNGVLDQTDMAVVFKSGSRPTLVVGTNNMSGPSLCSWDFVGPTFGKNYVTTAAGKDTTAPINAAWVSKEFSIEYGTFKWIVVYFQKQSAGSLNVIWSVDQGTGVTVTQSMTSGRGNVVRAVFPINQKGTTIQIALSNSAVNQTFRIYGVEIFYEPSEQERLL